MLQNGYYFLTMIWGSNQNSNEVKLESRRIYFAPINKFSRLIAENEHTTGGHLGVAASVAKVRAKYWIINLPRMMKSIRFKCVPCRIKQKLRCEQKMAELPPERLTPSPPFYVTGIDYFGPFPIRREVNKRVRGKCYGILFACFSSRAIHVDLSVDYSTDSFYKHFADLFQSVAGQESSIVTMEANWWNGATEALVKSVKKALSVILGEQVLTFSELQTVCFEAAQVVNQRGDAIFVQTI